jgi:hypothetical protein
LSTLSVTPLAAYAEHVGQEFLRHHDLGASQAIEHIISSQRQSRWSSEWRRLQAAVCATCVISACV